MTEQTKETLKTAVEEIRWLRRQNELLTAKVSTMELFALTLNTRPAYDSQPMSVDIAHELDRVIKGDVPGSDTSIQSQSDDAADDRP